MPGMDLPVSIAIGSAYVASVYATYTNGPAVWYDSVTMFVFFLTVARYLEMRARHRSVDRSSALASLLPTTATRVDGSDRESVAVSQLATDDLVLVRPGDSFPADGTLTEGRTSVNEAMLTGESTPRSKQPGDSVIAGSVNLDGVVTMRVSETGVDTTLGTIGRLSERARYARPAFVQLADKIASYIVIGILLVAASVATAWYLIDADRAFRHHIVGTRRYLPVRALTGNADRFCGSGQPAGRPAFADYQRHRARNPVAGDAYRVRQDGHAHAGFARGRGDQGPRRCVLRVRVSANSSRVESVSTHPIARAFSHYESDVEASELEVVAGAGVSGAIAGKRWRLGSADFVAQPAADADVEKTLPTSLQTIVSSRPFSSTTRCAMMLATL